MRNMSFSMTTGQVRARSKTVTRRLGWDDLKQGEKFRAIVKGQGLKKGEKVERMSVLECVSNTAEQVRSITKMECVLEGFPHMQPGEFVNMFCRANKCKPDRVIRRIEFRYVDYICMHADACGITDCPHREPHGASDCEDDDGLHSCGQIMGCKEVRHAG